MSYSSKTMRTEILQVIQSALSLWLKESTVIREDTNLITEIGIDSVGILQMILRLENEFRIEIPEYELDFSLFSSTGKFVDFIESKINANC